MQSKFKIDDEVEFITSCYLEYYQEREEEVRGRMVEKGTKGTIKRVTQSSTTWHYAVHLESTEYSWIEAPETILRLVELSK